MVGNTAVVETNDVRFAAAATAYRRLSCHEGLQSVCNTAMPLEGVPRPIAVCLCIL